MARIKTKKVRGITRLYKAVRCRIKTVLAVLFIMTTVFCIDYAAPRIAIDLVDRGYEEVVEATQPSVVHIACSQGWQGSGVFVSSDGLILTAGHVISGTPATYTITLNDRTVVTSTKACRLKDWDLGFIKVRGNGFPAARLGDSDAVQLGAKLTAIGSPFGSRNFNSVTLGILSSKDRTVGYPGWSVLLQTDAAANPGNSGCPVFTIDKEIAGIVVGSCTRTYAGIVYCVPSNVCRAYVESSRLIFAVDEFSVPEELETPLYDFEAMSNDIEGLKNSLRAVEQAIADVEDGTSDWAIQLNTLKAQLSARIVGMERRIKIALSTLNSEDDR